jgi:hypothetical protein
MAALALARDLSLYLLSLLALASAGIAWSRATPLLLVGYVVALAGALVLGQLLADALSGVGAAGWRKRARLFALSGFVLTAFVTLLGSLASPDFAAQATDTYAFLQPLALLLGEFLGLQVAALVGALVLVVLAGFAGGATAEVAVTGFVGLLAFFLTFDHGVRRLLARPAHAPHLLLAVARDAARTAGPVLLGLAVFFWLFPPAPSADLFEAGRQRLPTPQEARRAYEWLALLGLAGGALVFGLRRLFRGGGDAAAPLVESVETQVESEEILDPPLPLDPRYGAARGRVIRAYVRLVARARAAGLDIATYLTPREIERHFRAQTAALPLLTAIFMNARYGPDEPTSDDVRTAEHAAQEVGAGLVPRKGRRAQRSLRARG